MSEPIPLPAEVPLRLRNSAHITSAYNICRRLESSHMNFYDKLDIKKVAERRTVRKELVYIRILGYMIHHAPTDRGLKAVVEEISSAVTDGALLSCGQHYFDHFIRAFRSNKGRIPTPSNHASRPSFDTLADMMTDILEEASPNHSNAKKRALYRDGGRCVLTMQYDLDIYTMVQQIKAEVDSRHEKATQTELAHIFSESTNFSIDPDRQSNSDKRQYAASMWAIMRRFGHDQLPDDLNGDNVHRLENVMTMNAIHHTWFDSLGFWFEETDQPNRYKVVGRQDIFVRGVSEYVTFTTPDPVKYPLPNPQYLAIHAACAKVANMSGAMSLGIDTSTAAMVADRKSVV